MFKAIFTAVPFFFVVLAMVFFVVPAKVRTRAQAAWAMVFLFCAAKFVCFQAFGGDAFAPELPEGLIWAWNWAYSGMCLLTGLASAALPARWLAGRLMARAPLSTRRSRVVWLVALPVLAWGSAAVGVWNGVRPPRVVELEVAFENLPESLDGYRIVHLTDVHASAAARRWRTEAIVERVNALAADLVCLTGDYVDGMPRRQARNIEPLKNLKAKDGVIAVSGNHEYYFDMYGWWRLYHKWNMPMLENECVFPRAGLAVAGVPDPACTNLWEAPPDPDAAFASATNGEFRVLLQHRPFVDYVEHTGKTMKERADLQLSGHTHGGVAPGMARLVSLFNKGMVRGLYKGGDGRVIYVSAGAGQWAGFPIRFFDDPEIAVITLRREVRR